MIICRSLMSPNIASQWILLLLLLVLQIVPIEEVVLADDLGEQDISTI